MTTKNKTQNFSWQLLNVYLNGNLKLVKKQLGGVCQYLSLSKEKSVNRETGLMESYDAFNAVMKNDLGGTDRVIYRINKDLHLLQKEDFENLRFNLASRAYEKPTGSTETAPGV
jgi:hypothetical protein